MAYYRICPNCGSHLDPGEQCDCQQERYKAEERHRTKGGENDGSYFTAAGRNVPRWDDRTVRVG